MRWVWILLAIAGLVMANNYVPVKDGDWQALNIALEDLFYAKGGVAEAKSPKVPTSKKGIPDKTQQKTIDGSDGAGTEGVPVIGVPNDLGNLDLYGRGNLQPDVGVPYTGRVHDTLAGQNIPSSYFLDLRAHNNDVHTRHITADWLIVHDNSSPWRTIGLTNVDETCDVDVAGPIAGGRDQVAAFTGPCWVHFFIIYRLDTNTVSALVSLSATAPTLPTGYEYFVRVGAAYLNSSEDITTGQQLGNVTWMSSWILVDAEPAVAETPESVTLAAAIPTTAIFMFGYFGLSSSVGSDTWMAVSSTFATTEEYINAFIPNSGAISGGVLHPTYFNLPVSEAQTIYWTVLIKHPHYSLQIKGWVDDI